MWRANDDTEQILGSGNHAPEENIRSRNKIKMQNCNTYLSVLAPFSLISNIKIEPYSKKVSNCPFLS